MTDLATAEARGRRLEYIRKHLLNMSRPQFCENSGILVQSLKGWELGWGGGLTEKGAEKFIKHARILGAQSTVAWLLQGVGPSAVVASASDAITIQEDEQIARELLQFKEQSGAIDTTVTDDKMQPLLFPGDFVAGITAKDINKLLNKPCIILTETNEIWIRVLKSSENPGFYNLASVRNTTQHLIKDIKLKTAASIIWIRRRNPENYEG